MTGEVIDTEEFEAVLRAMPTVNLLTLSIDGKQVRCAEPLIRETVS